MSLSLSGRIAFSCIAPYAVTKYGVEAFSDALRREMYSWGIKVSIMEPGCFQTGMTQPAAIERQLRQCWNNLSDELKKEYGEEYLEKSTYTSNTRTKYFWQLRARTHVLCAEVLNPLEILESFEIQDQLISLTLQSTNLRDKRHFWGFLWSGSGSGSEECDESDIFPALLTSHVSCSSPLAPRTRLAHGSSCLKIKCIAGSGRLRSKNHHDRTCLTSVILILLTAVICSRYCSQYFGLSFWSYRWRCWCRRGRFDVTDTTWSLFDWFWCQIHFCLASAVSNLYGRLHT